MCVVSNAENNAGNAIFFSLNSTLNLALLLACSDKALSFETFSSKGVKMIFFFLEKTVYCRKNILRCLS